MHYCVPWSANVKRLVQVPMAELRQAQLLYAMRYHDEHGHLPRKEDIPATAAGCATRCTSIRPCEARTPENPNPLPERPSLRGARKRGRAVAENLRRETSAHEEVPVEEAEFVWDSDTSADTGENDGHPFHSVAHYRVTEEGATIPGKVLLTFLEDGSSMEVHPEQVHKAVRLLDPTGLRTTMCAKNCRCGRNCSTKFTLQAVRHTRVQLLNNSTNETSATEFLA